MSPLAPSMRRMLVVVALLGESSLMMSCCWRSLVVAVGGGVSGGAAGTSWRPLATLAVATATSNNDTSGRGIFGAEVPRYWS